MHLSSFSPLYSVQEGHAVARDSMSATHTVATKNPNKDPSITPDRLHRPIPAVRRMIPPFMNPFLRGLKREIPAPPPR